MHAEWQIELLGRLRASRHDRVITRFRTHQTGALLAYLAYYPQRPHPREELIERHWPECAPENGRRQLRLALWSLRRQLEPPDVRPGTVILVDRSVVQLNPQAGATDVAEFESAMQIAARASSGRERAQRLEQAVDLYRGPLLPGYFEDWILLERQRLAEAFHQGLRELIAHHEQTQEYPRAIAAARRAVTADPLREEAHHTLIRILAAIGETTAARRQYQEWERLLEAELNATPDAALRRLVSALPHESHPTDGKLVAGGRIAREDTADPDPSIAPEPRSQECPPIPPPLVHAGRLPLQLTRFFGREEEIARLSEMLLPGNEDRGMRKEARTGIPPASFLIPQSARLITLTGPGGSGKTRLALELARQLREPFEGAVWFAPLVDLSDPRLIPEKLLEALHLSRSPHLERLQQVVRFLSQQPSLLLLDNFEHLVAEGAFFVWALLEQVNTLTVIVTSRQRLGLAGEREFPVSPLPVPVERPAKTGPTDRSTPNPSASRVPELSILLACPSVQLFVDRAQAVRPDFQVTPGNASAVAALCAQLEGLPLALELAAARAGVLTPAQMLARLSPAHDRAAGNRFELLTSRSWGVDARHRSLRATLDWSYRLLPPELQRFFTRLSVFHGGWTLDAAEAVCGAAEVGGPAFGVGEAARLRAPNTQHLTPVVEYLQELRECSLIRAEEMGVQAFRRSGVQESGAALPEHPIHPLRGYPDTRHPMTEIRFRMLETVREYAAEQLSAEERADLARRHADHYQALAQEADSEMLGPGQGAGLRWYEREHDNLRAALRWTLATGEAEMGLRLVAGMGAFWYHRGCWAEGLAWLTAVLALERGAQASGRSLSLRALWGKALQHAGVLAHHRRDYEASRAFHEESLALRRELGDQESVAMSLQMMGWMWSDQGEAPAARRCFEEALPLWREVGSRWGVAACLNMLGCLARVRGDWEAAVLLLEESLAMRREIGEPRGLIATLGHLGAVFLAQGDTAGARARCEESLDLSRQLGSRAMLPGGLVGLARVALQEGHGEEARALLTESLAIREELGDRQRIAQTLLDLGRVAQDAGELQQAMARFRESLALRRDLADLRGIAECLEALASAANEPSAGTCPGNRRAVRLFGAAQALRAVLRTPVPPRQLRQQEQQLAALRAALGDAPFAATWEAGQALTWEQAAAEALAS